MNVSACFTGRCSLVRVQLVSWWELAIGEELTACDLFASNLGPVTFIESWPQGAGCKYAVCQQLLGASGC